MSSVGYEEKREDNLGFERWKKLIGKLPNNNPFNTIPEGEVTITFCGEPEEDPKQYKYNKGKNKGERHCVSVNAILHLSKNTANKVTEKPHLLGIARTPFQALFVYLRTNNLPLDLKGRTFVCKNSKNRKYEWKEIIAENKLSKIHQDSELDGNDKMESDKWDSSNEINPMG